MRINKTNKQIRKLSWLTHLLFAMIHELVLNIIQEKKSISKYNISTVDKYAITFFAQPKDTFYCTFHQRIYLNKKMHFNLPILH